MLGKLCTRLQNARDSEADAREVAKKLKAYENALRNIHKEAAVRKELVKLLPNPFRQEKSTHVLFYGYEDKKHGFDVCIDKLVALIVEGKI